MFIDVENVVSNAVWIPLMTTQRSDNKSRLRKLHLLPRTSYIAFIEDLRAIYILSSKFSIWRSSEKVSSKFRIYIILVFSGILLDSILSMITKALLCLHVSLIDRPTLSINEWFGSMGGIDEWVSCFLYIKEKLGVFERWTSKTMTNCHHKTSVTLSNVIFCVALNIERLLSSLSISSQLGANG